MQSLVRFILGKHTQMVDHNHPSFRNPPNLILNNIQLSFSTRETRITSGKTDPVTLQPFIAAPSLRVILSNHMTSNAHSKKLEKSHWNIPALIACCSPWYDGQACSLFSNRGRSPSPVGKRGALWVSWALAQAF